LEAEFTKIFVQLPVAIIEFYAAQELLKFKISQANAENEARRQEAACLAEQDQNIFFQMFATRVRESMALMIKHRG